MLNEATAAAIIIPSIMLMVVAVRAIAAWENVNSLVNEPEEDAETTEE